MVFRFLILTVLLLTTIVPVAAGAQDELSVPLDLTSPGMYPDRDRGPSGSGWGVWLDVAPRGVEEYVMERGKLPQDLRMLQGSADKTSLRINEFMADNAATLYDPADGIADDWFEIYNPGPADVNLQGLYLTDHLSATTQFRVAQAITVPAGGFFLFWADDETAQGPNHVNFRLGAGGEEIGIYDFDGLTRIDGFTFGPQTADVSQGRFPDGVDNWVFLNEPSPGIANRWQAPVISGTTRIPLLPAVTDTVTVSAQITDNASLLTTTLYYSVAGSGFVSVSMASLGDDLYAAQIPTQSLDSLVEYFVMAGDDDDQFTTDPPDAPSSVYVYRVGYEPPTLFINEFMADNVSTLEDPDEPTTSPDWIELYNPGPDPVDLGGLYLTDDLSDTTKFRISDSLAISAGGYLLFYADSEPGQGPFHTNFGLNAGGESVGLYDREIGSYQRIDAHTFGPQKADVSEGRCPDGGFWWFPLTIPTPGYTNEPCGPAPIISSVAHTPTLPSAIDTVTVTASIIDDGTVVSATVWFGTGTVFSPTAMTSWGGDVFGATIPPHPDGTWVMYYVWAEDDEGLATIDPPGAPTQTHRYLVGYQPPTVYLNEFMADNGTAVEDPDELGTFPDWIELYNPGPDPVGLGGLYLTDDLRDPTQFRITDSLVISAGGFVIFWADNDPEQGSFHTNFRLNAGGEEIGLLGAEGTVQLDAVVFMTQTTNRSYGRLPDGAGVWGLLDCSTPGRPNDDCSYVYLPLVIKRFWSR